MLIIFKSNIYFLILISFIASCAKNPVSGMPDFVTITEQQEIEMGKAYHKEILKNSKIIKNKELNKYYVELGEKIAKSSHGFQSRASLCHHPPSLNFNL